MVKIFFLFTCVVSLSRTALRRLRFRVFSLDESVDGTWLGDAIAGDGADLLPKEIKK